MQSVVAGNSGISIGPISHAQLSHALPNVSDNTIAMRHLAATRERDPIGAAAPQMGLRRITRLAQPHLRYGGSTAIRRWKRATTSDLQRSSLTTMTSNSGHDIRVHPVQGRIRPAHCPVRIVLVVPGQGEQVDPLLPRRRRLNLREIIGDALEQLGVQGRLRSGTML